MKIDSSAPVEAGIGDTLNYTKLPKDSICADIFSATFGWISKFLILKFRSITRNPSINDKNAYIPKANTSESSTVNSSRLQEIFEQEEAVNGRIQVSMLRVVWQFCKIPLLAASLLRLLSTILAITASMVLLCDLEGASEDNDPEAYVIVGFVKDRYHYSFVAYFLFTFGMYYTKSVSNWLSLRAAVRLRTACLAAAYTKLVESTMANRASVHQILNFTAGDNELIAQLVPKASILIAHTIGIGLCIVSTILLSPTEGLWNMLSILIILIAYIILVTISIRYFNKSMFYLDKKLSIVEECCRSFGNDNMLRHFDDFSKRFSSALSAQYFALSRAEVLQTNFPIDVILVLLGEFLVLLVDDTAKYMVLVLLNLSLTPILMFEWCEALNAVLQAKLPLEKVKAAIISAPTTLPKQLRSSQTKDPLAISVADATFYWSPNASSNGLQSDAKSNDSLFKLQITGLQVPRGHVVGITGGTASGKSSLIAALLGHMQIASGHIVRNGQMAYFPEKPYVLDENSVRDNVVFYQQFDADKYEAAMVSVQLGNNGVGSDPICENLPIEQLELTLRQLQKINLARAIFCDSDIIILENPLSALTKKSAEIFPEVCAKLSSMGKTVIVASQDDNILRHCQSVCLLIDGKTLGQYDNPRLTTIEAYQTSLRTNSSDTTTISYTIGQSMAEGNDLKDTLVQINKPEQLASKSICSYTMIIAATLMHLVTNIYCISLVVTLIFRHIGQNSFDLLCLIWLTAFRLITASYMYKAPSRLNKHIQRTMFSKLSQASMEPIYSETVLNRILHSFMDSHISVIQIRFTTIRCWVEIIAAGIIGMLIINTLQSYIIMFGGLIFYSAAYFACRASVYHYANLERKSHGNLLRHLTSQYNGRAVIQSFERIGESQERMYSLIEENSTTVFLRMSIYFFAQFTCHCLQLLSLGCLVSIDLRYLPNRSPEHNAPTYMILMFVFLRLTSTLDQLLDNYFDELRIDQRMVNVKEFLEKIQTTEPDEPKCNEV